ncbi:hypothetical protein [Lelliottia wanjuensis]|uniref:Uncharacterized protein n=1 Tax=Lelliottia wanjuensis TaxID=3050585 RepID=A0AAP4FSU6_9ENTR|nr:MULTISPECIES: hypothetical protein [unclassified Lelliottia]MDK9364158.1 hypothetical protein [Lelliottia sp. V106_12]MDK9585401.1 hypothetical protein [Lelliottia sp. V86_10]MDK9617165.1 hypothetical protein [Lelliottia sp. V106_9]
MAYFSGWQKFFEQYLCFNKYQHKELSELIYDLLVPQVQTVETTMTFKMPAGTPESGLKLDQLPEVAQARVLEILWCSLIRIAPGVNNQNTADIKEAASAVRIAFKELYS